jgi:hypothetical protein
MRSSLMAPMPNAFVSQALKTLGSQSVTNGCLIHNLQVLISIKNILLLNSILDFFMHSKGWLLENVIPTSILDKLSFSQLLRARSRAMAKIKKQQAASSKSD